MGSLPEKEPTGVAQDHNVGSIAKMIAVAGPTATAHARSANPYTPGDPVQSRLMLFGREGDLAKLHERTRNGALSALVGPPDIGVSSVLRQLAADLAAEGSLVAYADMTDDAVHGAEELSRLLWAQWWGQVRPGYVPEISGLAVLEPLARQLAAAGHKLVAILDSYEQLLWRPRQFTAEFQGRLEALVGDGVVALITGSHSSLAKLHQAAGSPSMVYTKLVQHDLGLLPEADALQLLMIPTSRARLHLPQTDARFFVDYAGTHPLYLQLVGAYLFAALEANRYDRDAVMARFAAAAEPHWQEAWESLSPPAQSALASRALGTGQATDDRHTRGLQHKGLMQDEGAGRQVFSRGFAQWIGRWQRASLLAGEGASGATQ